MGGSVECVIKGLSVSVHSDGMFFFSGERVFTNL